LAIVDRDERAAQPLTDSVAGATACFVGEIYNHREVRRQISDRVFHTESDTETILASYIKYGLQCFSLFRGMYAAVIVDERRGIVVLARDPVGKKPLYLAVGPSATAFGSNALAVVRILGERATVDDTLIEGYWNDGYVDPTGSIIRGLTVVQPGQIVVLDFAGKVIAKDKIDLLREMSFEGESGSAIRENVSRLIDTAVTRRLECNPNPTALLSGGIDSTVVAQAAARICLRRGVTLRLITLGSTLPMTMDEPYARYAAHRIGLPLEVLRIPLGDLDERVGGALAAQDEPFGPIAYFPLYELVKLARSSERILITGDGGDEAFLGYGSIKNWSATVGESAPASGDIHVGPAVPPWFSAWARRVCGRQLLGHMHVKLDRASAEQGVEIRCPLLDWDVLSYARSLPKEILFNGGVVKAVLKDQLSEWPAWFRHRRKIGFAFNLRWLWFATCFKGLRERISVETVERFEGRLPTDVRGDPTGWSNRLIHRHFEVVWKLLVWSAFDDRLKRVNAD
jgi:asparagine synthetase B (glutamine-hydrolysing)